MGSRLKMSPAMLSDRPLICLNTFCQRGEIQGVFFIFNVCLMLFGEVTVIKLNLMLLSHLMKSNSISLIQCFISFDEINNDFIKEIIVGEVTVSTPHLSPGGARCGGCYTYTHIRIT